MSADGLERFDRDPDALAWARAHVQAEIDKCRRFEREAESDDRERALRWRRTANLMQSWFIGGEGCSVARFDERMPAVLSALDGAS